MREKEQKSRSNISAILSLTLHRRRSS